MLAARRKEVSVLMDDEGRIPVLSSHRVSESNAQEPARTRSESVGNRRGAGGDLLGLGIRVVGVCAAVYVVCWRLLCVTRWLSRRRAGARWRFGVVSVRIAV
jgi:hypothetical protein